MQAIAVAEDFDFGEIVVRRLLQPLRQARGNAKTQPLVSLTTIPPGFRSKRTLEARGSFACAVLPRARAGSISASVSSAM
jgi:hypothetical protein